MTTWPQISSGRGPDERCRVAGKLLRKALSKARNQGIDIHLLEAIPEDEKDTIKSALVAVEDKAGPLRLLQTAFLVFLPASAGAGANFHYKEI